MATRTTRIERQRQAGRRMHRELVRGWLVLAGERGRTAAEIAAEAGLAAAYVAGLLEELELRQAAVCSGRQRRDRAGEWQPVWVCREFVGSLTMPDERREAAGPGPVGP
jgi:hypothetical protein